MNDTVTQDETIIHVPAHVERKMELPAAQSGSMIEAIVRAASDPRIDMDRAERLFKMHKELVAQQAEVAFNDAMARAQARILPVAHNAYNSQTKSYYAKLATINKAIVPIYAAEGFSVSFGTADCPTPDWFRTTAKISHSGGHSRTEYLDLPLDLAGAQGTVNKTKIHAMGSTRSYARRYLVCMIFNISTQDDDDGQRASQPAAAEPDPEGKKKLEACGSLASLQAAWKDLTAAQRKTLGATKDECKARIEKADKEAAA